MWPNPPLTPFFQKVPEKILDPQVPSVSKVSSPDTTVIFCFLVAAVKPVKLITMLFTMLLWDI